MVPYINQAPMTEGAPRFYADVQSMGEQPMFAIVIISYADLEGPGVYRCANEKELELFTGGNDIRQRTDSMQVIYL